MEKFGLSLAENHLPMGSLEFDQGLDVLVIMRHLHVFVARFSYNLNQQNFVERRPDRGSKNLNTISSKSIAASLRQHGLGILSTTVNFTYQFLAQKFKVFSHFLLDEYIRGHLSKERRWFRKHKVSEGWFRKHKVSEGWFREHKVGEGWFRGHMVSEDGSESTRWAKDGSESTW